MMKKFLLTCFVIIGTILNAQVSLYTFSQSTGSFNSIADTGSPVTGSEASNALSNDTAGWAVTLPFGFNFNGNNYASIYVNSNGAATFGTTTSTSTTIISETAAFSGAIGVMNRDLWGLFVTTGITTSGSPTITNVVSFQGIAVGKTLNPVNGIPTGATVAAFDAAAGTITMSANATASSATAIIRYGTGKVVTATEGTAPNRVFVIEWIGYNDYSTTASGSNYLNFQLRLAETSNLLSAVYGPQYNISTTSRTNQIGLRGAAATDFINRSGAADPWTSTTAGTVNTATVARDNVNFPAPGLRFTWSPPTCIVPSAITTSTVLTTSAAVSWTASVSAPANGYQVYYSTANVAPTAATVLTASNSVSTATTTAALNGLSPATVYYIWVRSVCSASDSSAWLSGGSITTACAPVSTLFENFDASATGNNLPLCWTRLVSGTGTLSIVSTSPFSGTRNMFLSSSTAANSVIAVLPEFNNVNAGTNRLRFRARGSAVTATFDIGYVTDAANAATFVLLQTVPVANITYATGLETLYNVPNTVPAGARLAIRNAGTVAATLYMDDFYWEAIPSCLAPVGPGITGTTANSASVSWSAPTTAPANGYQVYYSTTNTAPTAATVLTAANSVSTAATTTTITGLPADTIQFVWVRSNCSAGDQSVWVSAGSANTGYCTASSTSQASWISVFTSSGASTNMNYSSSAAASATGYANLTATNKISNYAGSVTPISLTSGGPTTGFAIWIDWNNNLTFEASEKVYGTTGYVTTTTDASITVPASVALGNYRMRTAVDFNTSTIVNPCALIGRGEYVDYTFEVTPPPSCLPPTAPVSVSNSTTTADVSWTASASNPALGYEIYYSTSATPPTAATPATVTGITGTTRTLTGLMSSTKYYAFVRANCSASDKSAWSGVTSFTTPCDAFTIPYAENFDTTAVGTITNNNAPNCWKYLEPTNWPGYGYVNPDFSSAPNGYYIYATDITGGGMLVSPATTNLMSGTNRIRFKGKAGGSNYNMEVGTLSDPNDAATFTAIGSPIVLTTGFVEYTVNIPAGTNQYLALRHPGQTIGGTSIRFDDIFVEAISPGLATVETSVKDEKSFTVAPNPFTDIIRISDIKDVVSVSIIDMAGRIAKTLKPAREMNLGDLKSGMYLINLTMKDGSVNTVKAIKK